VLIVRNESCANKARQMNQRPLSGKGGGRLSGRGWREADIAIPSCGWLLETVHAKSGAETGGEFPADPARGGGLR
jgi:hypothetical protein